MKGDKRGSKERELYIKGKIKRGRWNGGRKSLGKGDGSE